MNNIYCHYAEKCPKCGHTFMIEDDRYECEYCNKLHEIIKERFKNFKPYRVHENVREPYTDSGEGKCPVEECVEIVNGL